MAAPKGNRFWMQRSRHGVRPTFEPTPEGAQKLFEACQDYFQWCEDNPLYAEQAFMFKGKIVKNDSPRVRAFTIGGLCLFIDVDVSQWGAWWKERQDLHPIMSWAEQTIREQKFTAAAAGLLNAQIISRDLGLIDKTELSGPGGGPLTSITGEMTPQEAAEAYARTREAGRK